MGDVSSKDSWLPPHIELYNKFLTTITQDPPCGPPERFLREQAPALLRPAFGDPYGYARAPDGDKIVFRVVTDGEPVIYWTGAEFEQRAFSEFHHYVGEYFEFGRRLIEIAAPYGDVLLVDLGAGTCLQAITLRALGCDLPIVNLDHFEMTIGQRISESLGLSNMLFGAVDINAALANAEQATQLKSVILSAAAGRPVIVFSRVAISGFYNGPEHERLMDFIVNDLGAVAGVHLESCGHLTATFRRMKTMSRVGLFVSPKCLSSEGDLFAHMESRSDIEVVQREEVWPHQLHSRYPGFLSWRRITA